MSETWTFVGVVEQVGGKAYIEIAIDTSPGACHRFFIGSKTARTLARKLYWAARMVDGLNTAPAEPKK